MAKINQLPSATPLTGTELIPLVQGDETRMARADDLFFAYGPSAVLPHDAGEFQFSRYVGASFAADHVLLDGFTKTGRYVPRAAITRMCVPAGGETDFGGARLIVHDTDEFAFSRRQAAVFDTQHRSPVAANIAHDASEFALSGWQAARFDHRHRLLSGVRRSTMPAIEHSFSDYVAWTAPDTSGVVRAFVARSDGGSVQQISTGSGDASDIAIQADGVVRFRAARDDGALGDWRFGRIGSSSADAPMLALPFVCCWGDSMTQQGYPAKLAIELGATVRNFGISSQTSTAIAARFVPLEYSVVGGVIPASGPVALSPSRPGPVGNFASTAGSIGVTMAGIHGTYTYHPQNGTTFTRSENGTAVQVPDAVPVVVDPVTIDGNDIAVPNYRDAITVIRVGRNNITRPALIVQDVRRMVAYLRPIGRRYVIWPVYNARDEVRGRPGYSQIMDINRMLRAEFPDAYLQIAGVDAREHLIASATGDEAADVAADIIPSRLLVADGLHTNQAGQVEDARFCAQFIREKGWLP